MVKKIWKKIQTHRSISYKVSLLTFAYFNSTKEIRNRTEEHLALHYEGLVKDNENQLKQKFFETFEFYKDIYNCKEKMLQ